MKLSLPFLKSKKEEEHEYYLALLLTDDKANGVILEESLGTVKIIGKHEEPIKTSLETLPQDELIAIVDKTISRAEEVLPPNIETHKTVFGLKESWVEKDTKKIKKEYLVKLKKICDALDLTPIGFMVVSEAIANLLQAEEGAPLSAILIELDKKSVNLTLFRAGKISESLSGPLDDKAPVVVDNLLKQLTAPVLPTKIILFHTKEAKELSQQMMHHTWSDSLPFLHVPQVTILPADFDAQAVTYGASQQMGFELLGVSEKAVPAESKNQDAEATPEQEDVQVATDESSDFGFVADQDIANQEAPEVLKEEGLEPNDDIQINLRNPEPTEQIEDIAKEQFPSKKKTAMFTSVQTYLASINLPKFKKLPELLKKYKGTKMPFAIGGVVLILIIGLIMFYYNNAKAEIILSIKPNIVQQDENVVFSTTAGNDFSENIIAAKNVSTSIDGELSTNTTGKKDVGDKAKGTVTIFSKIPQSKTFPAGTVIESNDLEFTMDKDVTVASSSGDASSSPSTAKVDVTAKAIGSESNLPSGAKFSVAGFDLSDVVAKNDNAFSGGNKKSVTVVAKKDLDKLKSDLIKNLEKKALEELLNKGEENETVLPIIVATSLDKEKFDKKADDEAKSVKLVATVHFESVAYDNTDLENYEKSVLKDKYSQDISFADKSFKNEIKDPKVKDKKDVQAKLNITAGLLPKIDTDEVINKVKDKSPQEAKEILATLPQVAGSEIKFSPNILFLSNLYPRLPKNISIAISTDD